MKKRKKASKYKAVAVVNGGNSRRNILTRVYAMKNSQLGNPISNGGITTKSTHTGS
jgi:hypothetical protein